MSVQSSNKSQEGFQSYKFGGKELETLMGLNFYDFHARQYDPTLARFHTVDPLAEKYYSWSPYAYCANNPLRFIDPTGMDFWTTSDPDEIASFLKAITARPSSAISTFNYGSWNYTSDDIFLDSFYSDGLTYDDENNSFNLVTGIQKQDSESSTGFAYGIINVSFPDLDYKSSYNRFLPEYTPLGNEHILIKSGTYAQGGGIKPLYIEFGAILGLSNPGSALLRSLWNSVTTTPDYNKIQIARGKGERKRTAKADGTDNPFKKLRKHPTKEGWVKYQDQNGKWKEKEAPEGFNK